MEMNIDPDQNHNAEAILRSKISELDRKLAEEKQRYDQLESQLELAKLVASQEADRHRRDCLNLNASVARLEEDRCMLRERDLRDQEAIKVLLEDIESKEREFIELKVVNSDLARGMKKARDDAHESKNQRRDLEAQMSKLANETALQFERKERELKEKFVALASQNMELEEKAARLHGENRRLKGEENAVKAAKGKEYGELESRILRLVEERFHLVEKEKGDENEIDDEISGKPAHEIDDKMPKRTAEYSAMQKSSEKDFISSSEQKRKRVPGVIHIDSDGEHGSCDSVDEEDKITLSQHINKRIEEVAKRELGTSSLRQPSEFGSNGVKLTSSEVAAVRTPLGSAISNQKKSNGSCRLKKKVKRSDFNCSSTTRNPGSTDCSVKSNGSCRLKKKVKRSDFNSSSTTRNPGSTVCSGVVGEVGNAYRRRNFKNQTSEREYTGRTPSAEQVQHAKWKAETIQRTLKSCNPSFSKSMVRSHVSGSFWLPLPVKFCEENLPFREMLMILEDEKGLEYEVKCLGNKAALSAGWRGFALAHKLELGDALIFELSAPTRFKIYIIKTIPEESSKGFDESIAGTEPAGGTNKWANVSTTENQDADLSVFISKPPKADMQAKTEKKQD